MEHEGLPPGYKFGNSKVADKAKLDKDTARSKQMSKNLADIAQSNPDLMARSVPLEYDHHGLPIVEETSQQYQAAPPPLPPPVQASVPQQQARPQPAAPTLKQEELAVVHPVLNRMLKAFGLANTKSYDLSVTSPSGDKVKYTMTLMAEEATALALALAKAKEQLGGTEFPGGYYAYFQNMFISMSIIAIDDVPVWSIFGVDLTPDERLLIDKDPKNLPLRVRQLCGVPLANFLWTQLGPVGDKLWNYYEEVVAKENKVVSSHEEQQRGVTRYLCPLDGCTNAEFLKPSFEGGEEQPFYCKIHGSILVKAIDLKVSGDLPLV